MDRTFAKVYDETIVNSAMDAVTLIATAIQSLESAMRYAEAATVAGTHAEARALLSLLIQANRVTGIAIQDLDYALEESILS